MISFYCKKCELDQDLQEFVNQNQFGEWYQAKCKKCKGKVIRYITEKNVDPYFRDSKKLNMERKKYSEYFLQYGEQGFALKYPQSYNKFKEMEDNGIMKEEKEKAVRDNLYNKFRSVDERKILNKVYNES